EHSSEVFRQWATKHSTPSKCHDSRSVGLVLAERPYQALGHLDCHCQTSWNRVLSRHAPAHINYKHQAVAGSKGRIGLMPPTRLGECNDQADDSPDDSRRIVPIRPAALRQRLPALPPPPSPANRPDREWHQDRQEPE